MESEYKLEAANCGPLEWSDAPEANTKKAAKIKRHQTGTCRCCLAEGRFETMDRKTKQELNLSYCDMLRMVLGLHLTDSGPRLICKQCSSKLKQAMQFRLQVVAAEEVFISRVSSLEFSTASEKTECEKQFSSYAATSAVNSIGEDIKIELDAQNASGDEDFHDAGADLVDESFNILHEPEMQIKDELNEMGIRDMYYQSDVLKEKNRKRKYVKSGTDSSLRCLYCRLKFLTNDERDAHIRDKHLTCVRCNRTYATIEQKKQHVKLHPVQCSICEEIFATPKKKNSHFISVHGHKCTKCNERIKPHYWYRHNFEVHGITSTQCKICDKICRGLSALHRHQRMQHMKEKNVQCQHCGFMTFDQRTLNKHMISHSTEKKFACDYCNKRFIRKSTLRIHVMIHSGQKPKVCKLCGEAFVQRASLKYHLEKHHPGDCY